jgi:hypothetical protein
MATPSPALPDEEAASAKRSRAERLAAAVGVSVVNTLGRPAGLYRVSATRLWENFYRVNVLTGADAVSSRIAHSFFVAANEQGNVIESTPPITRLY